MHTIWFQLSCGDPDTRCRDRGVPADIRKAVADSIVTPVSRFGGVDRTRKKQAIIEKRKSFFERFFGISPGSFMEPAVYGPEPAGSVLKAGEPVGRAAFSGQNNR